MPSVPVYIRNEDYTKWLAIDNKAEFLHEALNKQIIKGDPKNVILPPIIKLSGKLEKLVDKRSIPKEMQPKFCKEGHPIPYGRDRCMGKGCKYS